MAQRGKKQKSKKRRPKPSSAPQPWQPRPRSLTDVRRRAAQLAIDRQFKGTQFRVEYGTDRVRIGSVEVRLTPNLLGGSADDVVDRIAAIALLPAMTDLVLEHLSGMDLRAVRGTHGVVLRAGHGPVALIRATHARIVPTHARVEGNFLRRGTHWRALRRAVEEALNAPVAAEATAQASAVVLRERPDDLDDVDWEAMCVASDDLRHRRSLAFGHTVRLRATEFRVAFDPIRERGGAVEVPVVFDADAGRVKAGLRLTSPLTPLAFVVYDGDRALVNRAWLFALLGYAELTCVAPADGVPPRAAPAARGDHDPRPARRDSRGRQVPRATRTHRVGMLDLSDNLAPTPATQRTLAQYVAGHRRRLPGRRRASDEARRRASALGIILPEHGQTWVSPHHRGLPVDLALEFRWQPRTR